MKILSQCCERNTHAQETMTVGEKNEQATQECQGGRRQHIRKCLFCSAKSFIRKSFNTDLGKAYFKRYQYAEYTEVKDNDRGVNMSREKVFKKLFQQE